MASSSSSNTYTTIAVVAVLLLLAGITVAFVDPGLIGIAPTTTDNTVTVINTGDLAMGADAVQQGWKFDSVTGKFIVNDNGTDSKGVDYDLY